MACIGIDCRFAATYSGLGTYSRNVLVRILPMLSEHHVVLFVRSSTEDWLKDIPEHITRIEIPYSPYSLASEVMFPLRLKQASVDLLYSFHFSVPLFCPCPFVTTIHDLILHRFPNQSGYIKQIAYRVIMRHAVRKSRRIISVSAFTQKELATVYGQSTCKKTSVITEGYDPMFTKTSVQPAIDPPFFLYVGNVKQHKNVQMLLDAHKASNSKVPLILVSSGEELSRLRIQSHIIILENLPKEKLPPLYSNATCFMTAALYEGFCLPILEARACGCPIVAANTSAIPEIAGDDAMLIPPTTDAFRQAFLSPPKKSHPPEDTYNWDTVSSEIFEILMDLL